MELYSCADKIIGKEKIIKTRRMATNLTNEYLSLLSELQDSSYVFHVSGSYGEGFRLETSDVDIMCIVKHIRIFTSQDDARKDFSDSTTKLLIRNDGIPPGFVKLKLLSKSRDLLVRSSLTRHASCLYLSSAKWNRRMPRLNTEGKPHGPCQNGILGTREIDLALSLKNDKWPSTAHGFIKRLFKIGWPSKSVIKSIISQGCHLVAIGCKESSSEDIEWRLSFSFTEEFLIREMNHCQFLCYGLLKIFLKEAIDCQKDLKGLMCSYFMKTIVFWEITYQPLKWKPSCLLERFWSCIRRLIHYVRLGYCPNFFIPENNMFAGKIIGRAQQDLLVYLLTIYNEGFQCLLRISSIRDNIQKCLNDIVGNSRVLTNESTCTKSELESALIDESVLIFSMIFVIPGKGVCIDTLSILSSDKCNRTYFEKFLIKCVKNYVLQYYISHGLCVTDLEKKKRNKDTMAKCLRVSAALKNLAIDCVVKNMLTALYLFRMGHFRLVIKYIQRTILKTKSKYALFTWDWNDENYRLAGGEHTPLQSMMRKVVGPLLFDNVLCLPELRHEIEAVKANSAYKILVIPPNALGHFLLYLSYRNEKAESMAREVLENMASMVLNGKLYNLPVRYQSISYIMLGICQELEGDYHGARESYHQSYSTDHQVNLLTDASKKRIHNLERNRRTIRIH